MALADNASMPRKASPHPKPQRKPTYIRAWRKKRGVTLEQLSDRLMVQLNVELSDGQLSRIERGESPYTQDTLEAIGHVLGLTRTQLLDVDPERPNQSLEEFLGLGPERQRLALRLVAAADLDKTGTEG